MEDCKGCYREINVTCALLWLNTHQNADRRPKNCPCMICIVKGICIDPCDDRSEFWCNEYNRIWNISVEKTVIQPIIEIPITWG